MHEPAGCRTRFTAVVRIGRFFPGRGLSVAVSPGKVGAGRLEPLRNARFRRTIPHPSEPLGLATQITSCMTDDPASPSGAITQWLLDLGRSDKQGLDQMLPVVYEELHRLASHYLSREDAGHRQPRRRLSQRPPACNGVQGATASLASTATAAMWNL